jgi:hypothetical protein
MSATAENPNALQARFRFISEPPEAVSLALGDFVLPERLRGPDFDSERPLTLSCGDIRWGPSPAVRLGVLSGLVPGHVTPDLLDVSDEIIPISAAALALRYELTTRREEIEPPPAAAPEPEPTESEKSPPVENADGPEQQTETSAETGGAHISQSAEPEIRATEEIPPAPAATAAPRVPFSVPPTPLPVQAPQPTPHEPELKIQEAAAHRPVLPPMPIRIRRHGISAAPPPAAAPPDPQPPPPQITQPEATPGEPAPSTPTQPAGAETSHKEAAPPRQPIPRQRRIMGIFPTARRKAPAPDQPSGEVPESVPAEAPPGPQDFQPPAPAPVEASPAVEPVAASEESADDTGSEEALEPLPSTPVGATAPWDAEPSAEAAPTATDSAGPAAGETDPTRHWEIQDEEVADALPPATEERMQELFLTEERINLDRALALCGGLPGIRSCILARGSSILGTHRVPDEIDIVSLTANAKAMLDGVRSTSMRMGLGTIPAITIHSEKGPVSFFYSGELLMLVLHADRGFVPGVRERLADAIEAMARAPLPLPLAACRT